MPYISKKNRKTIAERANFCCEYCLIPEKFSFFTYQIEHIISLKHGGSDELDNLAFSCPICNRNKGTDLGTIIGSPPKLTRFFHPRKDHWQNHFQLSTSGKIEEVSSIGKATLFIFRFNHDDAILQRSKLIGLGILKINPCEEQKDI